LFYTIYRDEVKDSFEFQNARHLFQKFIIKQSEYEEGFTKIRNVLLDIKKAIFDKQSLFFYINLIIDECERSYYNSVSKSYSFEEAKNIIRKDELKTIIMGDQINIGDNTTLNNNQIGGYNNEQTNSGINSENSSNDETISRLTSKQMDKKIRVWKNWGILLFVFYIIIYISAFVIQKNEYEIFGFTKQGWLEFKKSTVFEILKYFVPVVGMYLFYKLFYDRVIDPSKEKAKRDLLKSK
ncbi:hypothetical protein OMO38_02530, partial [Chryseobacterium sp. 09-1422]